MGIKKVLFVSYFFEPAKIVGAQRVSYWAGNISKIDENIICDVITAVPQDDYKNLNIRNIFYVPNTKRFNFLKLMSRDLGSTWLLDLKEFLRKIVFDYDVVLITGNPFMHFGIAKFIKRKFKSKVILDFRDPFANNPSFGNQKLKNFIKRYYEKYFIKNADHIISVNKVCLNLLTGYKKGLPKYSIIDNGYNEEILDKVRTTNKPTKKSGKISLIYAGSFFIGRNPNGLLDLITSPKYIEKFEFHHVGEKSDYLSPYSSFPNVIEHGLKSYEETISLIYSADVGLIFTDGEEFVSTTKIFDYIGLEKPILIISKIDKNKGTLHDIAVNYPIVFWTENKPNQLEDILDELLSSELNISFPQRVKFSRREGLCSLISIINKL